MKEEGEYEKHKLPTITIHDLAVLFQCITININFEEAKEGDISYEVTREVL